MPEAQPTRPSEDDMVSKPRARAMAQQLDQLDGECRRLEFALREENEAITVLQEENAALQRERDVLREYVEVLRDGGFFPARDWIKARGGDPHGNLDAECLRLADEAAKEGGVDWKG